MSSYVVLLAVAAPRRRYPDHLVEIEIDLRLRLNNLRLRSGGSQSTGIGQVALPGAQETDRQATGGGRAEAGIESRILGMYQDHYDSRVDCLYQLLENDGSKSGWRAHG